MSAADGPDQSARNVAYVYLLLKEPITESLAIGGFDLRNVLYVGKGTGYQWREHFHEALREVASPKAAAIRSSLRIREISARPSVTCGRSTPKQVLARRHGQLGPAKLAQLDRALAIALGLA